MISQVGAFRPSPVGSRRYGPARESLYPLIEMFQLHGLKYIRVLPGNIPRAKCASCEDAGVARCRGGASMIPAQSSAARGLTPGLLGPSSPHPTEFASLLSAPSEGLVLTDEAGLVRYVDPALTHLMGAGAPSELLGAPLVQALSRMELFDEQGARVAPERLTGATPSNPVPAPLVLRRLARDGGERWLSVTSRPIPDGAGQGGQVLHHVRDVTAHRRAVQGLQLLADTSSLLAASLDYTSTVPPLARRLVPELADGCSVDLLEPDGSLRPLALAFFDPVVEEVARELRQ